jgi:hypothetical protein
MHILDRKNNPICLPPKQRPAVFGQEVSQHYEGAEGAHSIFRSV